LNVLGGDLDQAFALRFSEAEKAAENPVETGLFRTTSTVMRLPAAFVSQSLDLRPVSGRRRVVFK
jgi:hypothetical protein